MHNDFPRAADLLESANHRAEITLRAQKAVTLAATLCNLLGQYADECENASRGAIEAARDLLHEDMQQAQGALREAAHLLDLADPLGCVDCSDLHGVLAEARACFHASLVALGVDALSLAA